MSWKLLLFELLFILAILCDGCDLVERNLPANSDLIIQNGYVCGWGAGTDSLIITKNEIRYMFYTPRLSLEPQILKSRSIPETEWNEIVHSFKVTEFEKLNNNTCNVCFDGCDEWIAVQNGQSSHKITFGKGMKIDTISQLQLKISALRTEFNP